ncbi:hypothetical protein AGDE_12494 [Angomonas deanei]|uniref:Uncharacterized protein n=1 Tax=Angomonas deanei TaxID=59799 RepID=A0A7G2CDY3_9TRYP|nr:hypothetical protein AGDE_12494 [Angomonas deanei]CAD2217074.1 hypothetical protein, conserved [Angomonas deanei]|eukprot:EPY24112.1 hypothetical protein AGDE_12494 [Angomonas deanei]
MSHAVSRRTAPPQDDNDDLVPYRNPQRSQQVTSRQVDATNNAQHFYKKDGNTEAYGYYYNSQDDPNRKNDNSNYQCQTFFYSSSSSSPQQKQQQRVNRQPEAHRRVREVNEHDDRSGKQRSTQPIVEEPDDDDDDYTPQHHNGQMDAFGRQDPFTMHQAMMNQFFGGDAFGGFPGQRGRGAPTSFADQMMMDMENRHRQMMDNFFRF